MITLQEYCAYKQITSPSSQDGIINTMIPIVTSIIEEYLDRNIESATNIELINIQDNNIFTENYPINRILYVGVPTEAIRIEGLTDGQSMICEITGLYYYSSPFATPTSFLFSTSTTFALLKAAVETAIPTLTLNLLMPSTTLTSFLLESSGSTIMYPARFSGTFIKRDSRTIELIDLDSCGNLWSNQIYLVYTSGWDIDDVPPALKKIAFDMVSDLVNILSLSTNSGIKSESLGDYSYTLADVSSNLSGDMINKYKNDLYPFVKKWI